MKKGKIGVRIKGLLAIYGAVMLFFGFLSAPGFSRSTAPTWLGFATRTLNIWIGVSLLILILFAVLAGSGLKNLMGQTLRRRAAFGLGSFCYIVLFLGLIILLNVLAVRREWFRYDSTEQKVYTLAQETRSILSKVDRPVLVRAFFVAGEIDERTRDLLDQLQQMNPFLRWAVVDPEKNPMLVRSSGVSKAESLHFSFEQDTEARSAKVEDQINEESVANALLKLIRPQKIGVYAVQGNGELALDSHAKAGMAQLKQAMQGENMSVSPLVLDPARELPADARVIILAGTQRSLLESVIVKLKNFLNHGGRVLFLVEPNTSSNLDLVLSDLGIKVGKDMVIDHLSNARGSEAFGIQPVVSSFGSHPLTKGFNQSILFTSVSSVSLVDVPRADLSPSGGSWERSEIAFTGSDSWAETNLSMLLAAESQAAKEDSDLLGPVPVAVAASLKVGNEPSNMDASAAPLESRVVVIGDVDFATNFGIKSLYNRDFLLNAVNWLAGIDDGITLRVRTMRESRQMLQGEQVSRLYLWTVVVIPELFFLFGLTLWWGRNRKDDIQEGV